ncbi:hypothetical protein F4779DRAFT_603916, partial [Xylariaceae sp. FL0662B]
MSSSLRILSRRCPRAAFALGKTVPAGTSQSKSIHSSNSIPAVPSSRYLDSERITASAPSPPEPMRNPTVGIGPHPEDNIGQKRLADFDLKDRVFVVTGGARGLGLALAEAL